MKKFMKACVITAAVLCLLGLLLGVTAGSIRGREAISKAVETVTGGKVTVSMDDIKGWGIMVGDRVGDIAQLVDNGVNYDLGDSSMFEHSYKIYKGNVSKYCPGSGIENLDVKVGGCVFETKTSGDGKFYIEVTNSHKFQGYVKDDTLYIKASSGAKTWNRIGSCSITLYVPEDFEFESVEMELGAGVMEFSNLRALDEISLEVGAGQIVIDKVKSPSLELEIGAGEIQLKGMEAGKLSAEIGMGNFTAKGSASEDVDIKCSMGNVDLKLSGSEQSFNYSIECAMGNVDLGGSSYSGLAKEKNIQNGADKTMEIECSMGNITVKFDN